MFCNVTAFQLGSGCPQINVNLSFPVLSYCSGVNFAKSNGQLLHIPDNHKDPEVAGIDVACIEILATGQARLKGAREANAHGPGDNARFTLPSGVSGCSSGLYRMVLDMEIPCMLDGIPDAIKIKVAGVEAGEVKFGRGSRCSSITVQANIETSLSNQAYIMEVAAEDCLLDDEISGEVVEENREDMALAFEKNGCRIKKLILKIPPICKINEEVGNAGEVQGKPSDQYAQIIMDNPRTRLTFNYLSGPAIEITSPDFHISHIGNHYWISGYRASYVGPKGKTGPTGDSAGHTYVVGDVPGYTGKRGSRGPRGTNGKTGMDRVDCGDMVGYTGSAGPERECSQYGDLTCKCPHNVIWDAFTGILTVDSCQIVGNAIQIQYRKAIWHVKQDYNGLAVNVTPIGNWQKVIPGQELITACNVSCNA